jgi:Na+/H+-translocating membrane pyrophosphatase
VSLLSKIILLAVALVASIIAVVWILMGISEWAAVHQYETVAIVTVIILSIVAFVWRAFLWKEEG